MLNEMKKTWLSHLRDFAGSLMDWNLRDSRRRNSRDHRSETAEGCHRGKGSRARMERRRLGISSRQQRKMRRAARVAAHANR
jgi:hypothetical protein